MEVDEYTYTHKHGHTHTRSVDADVHQTYVSGFRIVIIFRFVVDSQIKCSVWNGGVWEWENIQKREREKNTYVGYCFPFANFEEQLSGLILSQFGCETSLFMLGTMYGHGLAGSDTRLTSNATETTHKLASLLRLVRDDFERCTKVLVVVSQPFQQRLILDQLHLDAALNGVT